MSNISGNTALRLARMEAICNSIKSEMDDVMRMGYEQAVSNNNEELAAEMARKIRNRMLDESDAQMSLDRIGLDTSTATSFLTSLKKIFNNDWAVYRQHLRDITEQEGFPFDIDWGTAPDVNKEEGK
jgi:hypothetical protein